MAEARRPFCSETSAENGEPVGATASHVERWILLEYRGLWSPQPLRGSMLPEEVKAHLEAQLAAAPRSRLLFIRQPRREHHGVFCYTATTPERGGTLFRLELESHDDLVDLDLFGADRGDELDHPLLAVCTHGKRDRCCARYGRPLYDAVADQVARDWVWQCTHVGGDRFAGNLVSFPEGIYFGRVGLGDVWPLLDDYLVGRIYLDCYRGRSCYPFPVQAGERAIREETGLRGIDDLTLSSVDRVEGGWRVVFEAGGASREAVVEARDGDLTYLTCDADLPRRPRRYVAVS